METLVAQTQARTCTLLKRNYKYDSNLKPAQAFLLNHVNSKIPLVVMYVDLVGSTNMCMTLPVDKLVSIIRAFTYEISSIIQNHKGYVLKYVGDSVIAFFPSSTINCWHVIMPSFHQATINCWHVIMLSIVPYP